MKKTLLILTLAAAGSARAQWQTTNYTLKGGWNAIHLSGDAAWGTLDNMLPAAVEEVWRWNPNPTQLQFTQSPLIPAAGTPDWSVWRRGQPGASSLSQLTGQASYLVKCTGTAATVHTVSLKQAVLPPGNTWVRSGANLMGFPSLQNGANSPLFTSYFATFPIATAANTRIFKYDGGDLGPSNPVQVFSPSLERMDRTKAYWFSAEVVGNFYAPLEISLSTAKGLTFGRTGTTVTALLRNRTAAPVTITLTPVNSEFAPPGQPQITGPVPLSRRTFDGGTAQWVETPITAAFTTAVGPQSSVELQFAVNRTDPSMTGAASGATFGSFLRVTDSGNLFDIYVPASAQKASLAGLWVGDISLTKAGYNVGAPGQVPREFPLRTLLHVADDGTTRLLSKVFIGQLAAGAHDVGLCTDESLLKQDAKSTARRLVATHLPLTLPIGGAGTVSIGGSLTRTVTIGYQDETNPFIHQYHPDHDNKDPRGATLPAGKESYNITRACSFTFTSAPPPGTSAAGWGSTVIGGDYSEVITGLHRNELKVAGTFTLRRASELGTLHLP